MENVMVKSQFHEAYSNQYDESTKTWRELGAIQKAQNIIDIVAGEKYENILEIGAGDGNILKFLSQNNFGKILNAVEISKSGVVQILEKNIPNLDVVRLFDGYILPFKDKEFDLVILSHVLEHVEHERILLREIHRVAKNFIIEVPKDYRFGADRKLNHFLAYGHINLYTPTQLKYLLLTENFVIKREILRLYSKKTFIFGKNGVWSKLKAYSIYYFKLIMISLPFGYINHKFINTITLLVKPNEDKLKIF